MPPRARAGRSPASRTGARRTGPGRADSPWPRRLTKPGWLLLPLRVFLGVTFTYAGLQKVANPGYIDPHNPTSVVRQMALLHHRSPIGPLLGLSLHAPAFVGLLIAVGELAVGVGTLIGLWSRIAAVGGAFLALTFFLTVSWNTTPYYYGADIVFVFAWLVMFEFGNGGVLSVDGWLRNRARRDLGLGPEPATIAVAVPRLRKLCARGSKCGLTEDGTCTRPAGCPVFPVDETLLPAVAGQLGRRTIVLGGVAAGIVGVLALATAGVTAVVGRALGRTNRHPGAATGSPGSSVSAANPSSAASGGPSSSGGASGTAIAAASSIALGQAKSFTNPADGNPTGTPPGSCIRPATPLSPSQRCALMPDVPFNTTHRPSSSSAPAMLASTTHALVRSCKDLRRRRCRRCRYRSSTARSASGSDPRTPRG